MSGSAKHFSPPPVVSPQAAKIGPPPLAVLWASRTWGFLSSPAVVASIVVGAVAVVLAPERNTQLLTDRARMAGQLNKPEDRHVEGSKRK